MTSQPVPSKGRGGGTAATLEPFYEYPDTRELVALVHEGAELVRATGEAAFDAFRVDGSRWRRGETYVFVLDPEGAMVVHPDPALEGRNQLDLEDINGKPIIRGLLAAATAIPGKPEGWYHYQWPVPGELLPRWKSSFVRLVTAPSGQRYLVGSGVYNDRMERAFVVDLVERAVRQLEERGREAFSLFRDPTGPFIVKDGYIFVIDRDGVELLNPAFPNLEGRSLLDLEDAQGKRPIREMLALVTTSGSGWVDYQWPRPGESVSTRKSAYVQQARMGRQTVLVGCGVYLADAPRDGRPLGGMTAPELRALVHEAGVLLAERGEEAYPELRKKGSKWLRDDTYFFVWTLDGTRVFHAADPAGEGRDETGLTDIVGRPIGQMILAAGNGPTGEGWLHYMYPQPGSVFPAWKSTFVKRVTYPSGRRFIVGCGIYNMQMDKTFIEQVVNDAAELIAKEGRAAFGRLRDRKGPFVFMDTYVFVDSVDGVELVNPAQPSLEGRNLMDLTDLRGRAVVREEIAAALEDGSAWLEYYWYRPGDNVPARKETFVRKVETDRETFVVGSGIYLD